MSAVEAVTALLLVCAGNPTRSAQAEQGTVAVMRVPVSETMHKELRSEPPVSRMRFVGEVEPQREWLIGGPDPDSGKFNLLRLTRSNDPLSPFAFKAGEATEQEGLVAFAVKAEGKCYLRPSKMPSKGGQE